MTTLLPPIEQLLIEEFPSRLVVDGLPTQTFAKVAAMAGGDPTWCSGHYEPSSGEAFHQHTLSREWGDGEEKIRVGMSRFDSLGRPGAARVEIVYAASDSDGSIALEVAAAEDFAGCVLLAAAINKGASAGRLALYLQCLYESGKAFAAAVRNSRTASPRTASSHSRSMSAM
jgi:hypothetical protein